MLDQFNSLYEILDPTNIKRILKLSNNVSVFFTHIHIFYLVMTN